MTLATHTETNGDRIPQINLIIAVESPMDGQLFKKALERPRQRLRVLSCAVLKSQIADSIERHPLDIALVSENLQDGRFTGFRLLNELRTLSPQTRSIMLLRINNFELVLDAFRAGAKGVFCRTDSLMNLPKCIRCVHNGQIWANSTQLDQLLDSLSKTAPLKINGTSGRWALSKRDDQIVKLVAKGFSNGEVAHKLSLTEHAVSNHLLRIYEKLGISSRVELVLCSPK